MTAIILMTATVSTMAQKAGVLPELEDLPPLPTGVYEITGMDTLHAVLMLLNTADNALMGILVGVLAMRVWMKRQLTASSAKKSDQ